MAGALIRALWKPLVGLLLSAAIYWRGRRDAAQRADLKADRASLDTIRRIQDAQSNASAGGADWRERLRMGDKARK
ncbi:hypothetical protein [Falsigemmobacter faecalis]|uniref:Uncharacterized protein n=1 Tax=Falsigemmobacter faecalis TaxID=2488730 RepID=A0A3P3D605_9RHOB|nr:hypothetical protein [Falsigemmobacter faecalis]RRH69036.1 hypothetical protein EG244_18935 [Falsigemmobacter faecalis]